MKEFIQNYWQWIVGTIIAILGLLISYLSYKKKNPTPNKQTGGDDSVNVQSSSNINITKNG